MLAEPIKIKLPTTLSSDQKDYDRIGLAIDFLEENYLEQPTLEEIAAHCGLSQHHFQRLFTRWAGISPKRFMGYLTLGHAKSLLRNKESVLDAAYDAGLSGPGRLHDLFISYDSMTPGEYKLLGKGMEVFYGWHDSPFGQALLMATDRGLCGLAFEESRFGKGALQDMAERWPNAAFFENKGKTREYANVLFGPGGTEIKLHLLGTNFQIRVWEALLHIPPGQSTSYADVAAYLGNPNATRAVGTAVGRNPISYLIPCHRVLRGTGQLGGYHWGLTRKKAMLAWESAHFSEDFSHA